MTIDDDDDDDKWLDFYFQIITTGSWLKKK